MLQWTVQDGVLEVEGVSGETAEEMELKYEGVNALDLSSWITDGVVENNKGFRMVRKMRNPGPDGSGWCSVEVRTPTSPLGLIM